VIRRPLLILALLLGACHGRDAVPVAHRAVANLVAGAASAITLQPGINVRDFGATGDGVTDDRAAIQAALDAGAGVTVHVPAGRYLVGKGAGFWCLTIRAGTTLLGDPGAVFVQAGGTAASVRLLEVDTAGVVIDGLVLDGNRAAQVPDEHRAGIFADGAGVLTIRNVTAQNFAGDGLYLHTGSNGVTLDHVTAIGNSRNGLTLGGGTTGTVITHGRFVDNGAQQLDSEPGTGATVDGVTITDSTLDGGGVSGDFVLTVSGSGEAVRSRGWTVERNIINGPINVVWATDVVIRGNRGGINATGKPCVTVYRSCDRVRVADNDLVSTGAAPSVVEVVGTGIGQAPDHVVIERNVITTAAVAFGIHVITARDVQVVDNEIRGAGKSADYNAGVYARATVLGEDIRALVVRGNRIADFGAYAVSASSSPGAIRLVDVTANVFDDVSGSMPAALSFDTAVDVRQAGNLLIGGCATLVAHAPAGSRAAWGDGDRWVAQ
jgi:hypothetical protein